MTYIPRWARDARNGDVIDRDEAVQANFETMRSLPYIERILTDIWQEVRDVNFHVRMK